MFFKLALGNVRKSVRDYAVYFVTLALGVAVFYAFNTISGQADFLSTNASEIVGTISSIMTGTTVFLAFVLGFLMVYANNYLVKRRKRELGLYQVLGMTRGQVSSVLVLETLMASLLAFVAGIAIGLIFSQLLVFVTANFLHDRVHDFAFRVSPEAMGLTLLCFGIIFLVMLAFNLRTLRKVRLVDLMGAERRNGGCGQKLDHPDGGPDWGPHVHEEREDEDPRGALGERASPRDRGGTTRLADARDAEAVGGTGRRRRAGRQASREALPREAPPLRPQGEGRGAEAPLRRRSHARHQGQARDREQDGDLVVGAGGPGW